MHDRRSKLLTALKPNDAAVVRYKHGSIWKLARVISYHTFHAHIHIVQIVDGMIFDGTNII